MNTSEGFLPADAPAFRTKYGHELKNQKWYREKINLWNDPIHTGTVGWRLFHAPRIAQDLAVKERLEAIERADEDNKAKLTLLKHVHDETRTRMQCQASDRMLKQTAQSFDQVRHFQVPRLRSDFTVYPRTHCFSDFTRTVDKFRKQAVTDTVIQRDSEALDHVREQLGAENKFRQTIQAWEKHRHDLNLDDFRQRQQFIDKLSRLSGQLVVHNPRSHFKKVPDYIDNLSQPKAKRSISTPRELIECKGLLGIPRERSLRPVPAPVPAPAPEPNYSKTKQLMSELDNFEKSLQGFELEPKATGALDFTLPPKKRTLKVR